LTSATGIKFEETEAQLFTSFTLFLTQLLGLVLSMCNIQTWVHSLLMKNLQEDISQKTVT